MTEKKTESEWTGIKGKIFAWHLENPVARLAETMLLGSEIYRVTKTGGCIIITDFRDTLIGKMVSSHGWDAHGPFNIIEFEALLAKTGFRDLKVNPIRSFLLGVGRK